MHLQLDDEILSDVFNKARATSSAPNTFDANAAAKLEHDKLGMLSLGRTTSVCLRIVLSAVQPLCNVAQAGTERNMSEDKYTPSPSDWGPSL